jgi:hypothetical protein
MTNYYKDKKVAMKKVDALISDGVSIDIIYYKIAKSVPLYHS